MNSISATQIMMIGVVATVVAGLINLYLKKSGRQLGRRWITVGLYVISIILAYTWGRPLLPAFPAFPAPVDDPGQYAALIVVFFGNFVVFLGELVAAASAMVGFATAIYNVLLSQVLEKVGQALGWLPAAKTIEERLTQTVGK
jgi:hypothetical protein